MAIMDFSKILSNKWLSDHWRRWEVIIIVLSIFIFFGLYWIFNTTNLDISHPQNTRLALFKFLFIVFSAVFAFTLWLFFRKPPTNKKDKIGIAIAITCENHQEKNRIKIDFINALRKKMLTTGLENIHIIELPEYYSAQLNEDRDLISSYLNKTKANLMLVGTCRIRKINSEDYFALDITTTLRHIPIPKDASKNLSKEMSTIILSKAEISINNDLEGFSLTTDYYKYGVTYILGLANFIGGDVLTAFNMHHSLLQEIGNKNDKNLITIKKFLSKRIIDETILCARLCFLEKKSGFLDEANNYLKILNILDPDNYYGHLVKAIYLFIRDRNIKDALKEIKKAKNENDNAWRFSKAFLFAYQGKLDEAHNIYLKAFNSNYSGQFLFEIEKFIEVTANEERNKAELLYCLGLINYYAKEDYKLAHDYWSLFILDQTMKKLYPRRVEFVEKK